MRTLKRTLCLVLALVMVLGLCVTNVSAVDAEIFQDLKQSKHQEAIKVLAALDVVQGENGQLKLDRTLTRAEMASLIYQLIGKDSKFVPTTTFTDVKEGAWYYTAIAFCQNRGILSGNGDGTVTPEEELTGYMLGSMLLGVIGYDREYEIQKLKDKTNGAADWKFATYTYVLDRGLDKGLSVDYPWGQSISRDDAFQMVFNTLTATMVEYDSNGSFTLPDGTTWNNRGSAKDITRNENANSSLVNYAGEDDNAPGYGYLQVCERYWPKLTMSNEVDATTGVDYGHDKFMRPGHTWLNNGRKLGFILDKPSAAYYDTTTGTMTGKIAKALSRNGSDLDIYYNGAKLGDADKKWSQAAGEVDNGHKWGDDTHGIPGYEFYIYGKDVILREAFLAVVGATNKSTGDIKVKIFAPSSSPSGIELTVAKNADVYDDLAAHEEGDYIAVYPTTNWVGDTANAEILEIAELETKQGTVTEVYDSKANGKWESTVELKVNGEFTTYEVTQEAVILPKAATSATDFTVTGVMDATKLGATTLYLVNGYILMIDQRPAVQDPQAADAGFAYFYDVKEIPKNDGDTSNKWDSEGGNQTTGNTATKFMGRLLLSDKSTLGGEDTGVEIFIDTTVTGSNTGATLKFEDYEKDLGKLVMYNYDAENDRYEIIPIAGVNLGGLTTTTVTPPVAGDTYVNVVANSNTGTGVFTTATQVTGLKITKNKSEGVMPSNVDMATLGSASAQGSNVAFDKATAIYVVKTGLNSLRQPDFDYECNVYTIETLPADIDISRGLVTVVGDIANPAVPARSDAAMLDGNLNGKDLKVARAVLIVDSTVQETSNDTYFIVRDYDAPLVGLYKNKDSTTQEFWFYQYDAVVNGKYQKVLVAQGLVDTLGTGLSQLMFDGSSQTKGTDNYWLGTGVTLGKDYTYQGKAVTVIENIETATALDSDTLVLVESLTEYKNGRIGVNGKVYAAGSDNWTSDWTEPSSESYLVETDGKAFTFDLYAGTITEIKIDDFTKDSVATGGGKYGSDVIGEAGSKIGGIAIRDSSHKILTALFINLGVAP